MDEEKMFYTSYKKRPVVYFSKNGDLIADIETDNASSFCCKARDCVFVDKSEIISGNIFRIIVTADPSWGLKEKEKKLMMCLEKIFSI